MFVGPPPPCLTHLHRVCPFPHILSSILLLSIFLFHFCVSPSPSLSLLSSVSPSVCLLSPFFFYLSDKLDEILAAAQQTISTNEAPGTRGQGPKRDRGRSFYGNEVCFVLHNTVCVLKRVPKKCTFKEYRSKS